MATNTTEYKKKQNDWAHSYKQHSEFIQVNEDYASLTRDVAFKPQYIGIENVTVDTLPPSYVSNADFNFTYAL